MPMFTIVFFEVDLRRTPPPLYDEDVIPAARER